MHGSLHFHDDIAALNNDVAERFVTQAAQAQADHGHFYVALAGGSTPRQLYQLLASDDYRERIDWSQVSFFFGDERYVPHDHADSNYRMAREALFLNAPIPLQNIHPIATQLEPAEAAAHYSRLLARTLPQQAELPALDLVLLGMGDDGHTASLFPDSSALQDTSLCAATYVEKFQAWRLTLTYAVINNAARVWVLVAGASKAPVLAQLRQNSQTGFPIARVKPRGELLWFVDSAAAGSVA